MIAPISENDLHAYVDHQLTPERRQEVDSYLAERPDEMQRVQAYIAQNAALHSAFNPILNEPVPRRMLRLAANDRTYWQRLAAGLLIAIVSGSGGWLLHMPTAPSPVSPQLTVPDLAEQARSSLAHQAAIAHVVYSPEITRPVEIGAEQEDQLVTWLSKRLGSKINPPKLGKLGYELIGGRLLPGQNGPVAQFMYHNIAGQRLTVYVSTDQSQNKDTGFRFAQEGPVNVFYWIDGKFGYALSAGIDKGELARIATAVYQQLQKPG